MSKSKIYRDKIVEHMQKIWRVEKQNILDVASLLANEVKRDNVFYIYGPGGHSNIAAQEAFFRAGGLVHVSAILDEGTHLKNGALRSMRLGRLPGYGRTVISDYNLKSGDVLLIVNAYGINTVSIDAAIEAKKRDVTTVSISSAKHADNTPSDHPVRHPTKRNLHEMTDYHVDSHIEIGDAVMRIENLDQPMGPISTFINSFIVNTICLEAVTLLVADGVSPPIWKSANVTGGDEWNEQYVSTFKDRIAKL